MYKMGYKIEEERLVFYTKKFLCLGCMVDILVIYREMCKFEIVKTKKNLVIRGGCLRCLS